MTASLAKMFFCVILLLSPQVALITQSRHPIFNGVTSILSFACLSSLSSQLKLIRLHLGSNSMFGLHEHSAKLNECQTNVFVCFDKSGETSLFSCQTSYYQMPFCYTVAQLLYLTSKIYGFVAERFKLSCHTTTIVENINSPSTWYITSADYTQMIMEKSLDISTILSYSSEPTFAHTSSWECGKTSLAVIVLKFGHLSMKSHKINSTD